MKLLFIYAMEFDENKKKNIYCAKFLSFFTVFTALKVDSKGGGGNKYGSCLIYNYYTTKIINVFEVDTFEKLFSYILL